MTAKTTPATRITKKKKEREGNRRRSEGRRRKTSDGVALLLPLPLPRAGDVLMGSLNLITGLSGLRRSADAAAAADATLR